MRRTFLAVTLVLAGIFGLSAGAGCVIEGDDASTTCANLDDYLATCYPNCAADWSCEDYYDTYDIDTQIDLDDCSDCLYAHMDECADCAIPDRGISSCIDFLTSLLPTGCY